jgi:hypothetical protein
MYLKNPIVLVIVRGVNKLSFVLFRLSSIGFLVGSSSAHKKKIKAQVQVD